MSNLHAKLLQPHVWLCFAAVSLEKYHYIVEFVEEVPRQCEHFSHALRDAFVIPKVHAHEPAT